MYPKLSTQATDAILEAGIDEFALKGPDGASMQAIANRAAVSVGVL